MLSSSQRIKDSVLVHHFYTLSCPLIFSIVLHPRERERERKRGKKGRMDGTIVQKEKVVSLGLKNSPAHQGIINWRRHGDKTDTGGNS